MKTIVISDGMFNAIRIYALQLINESFEELRKDLVFSSLFCVFDAIIKIVTVCYNCESNWVC